MPKGYKKRLAFWRAEVKKALRNSDESILDSLEFVLEDIRELTEDSQSV